MTDKEKLEKLKKLADAMYYAAFNMTTDASLLKKAIDDYHQFIINEYYKEEPVSIWHDASEEPNINSMIIYKCNGHTPDIGRFLGVVGIEGHFSWDIFKYPQSIIINNIEKWAYIDDIINL